MIVGIISAGKPPMSQEMKDAIKKAAQAALGIKEEKTYEIFSDDCLYSLLRRGANFL